VRLAAPDSPTLLAERQYRSALITRFHYYEQLDSVEPWRLRIASLNREREGRLEPPILERFTAALYRATGGEHLWIPRALSTVFWILGGVFLYRLALRFLPFEGAALGTAYYLFHPVGVHVSVSILPDPLMIALFILSLLALVRLHEHPTVARLGFAAGVSAVAVLVKPFCLFAIAGAVVALGIHRRGFGRRAIDRSLLVLLAAVAAPTLAYYGYGVLVQPRLGAVAGEVAAWESLVRSASVTFVPRLLLTTAYWDGWARTALHVMGWAPLVAALFGFALLRDSRARALVTGLLAGYVAFCLAFTYLIPFAGHYHLQLIVVIALGLGQLGAVLLEQLRNQIRRPLAWVLPVAAALLIAMLGMRAIRNELRPGRIERPEVAKEIGDLIDHSERVAVVATYYGKPLQYFGEFYGTWWPSARGDYAFESLKEEPRSIAARVETLGFEPEYFVITDFRGYDRRHPDLREYLEGRCSLIADSDDYRIYGECGPAGPIDARGRAESVDRF
jgi:hypothetical protein